MDKIEQKARYSKKEDLLNTVIHAIGIVLSLISLVYLIYKGVRENNVLKVVGFSVYGICLTLMFLSSTLYHSIPSLKIKKYLRLVDHCAIFLCIAGTYTPIILIANHSNHKLLILSLIWIIAIWGIVFKINAFFKNTFNKLEIASLVLYALMGWISIFLIKDMIVNIGLNFFIYILVGGLLYSIGIYFYKNKKIKYNHAIWHIFILAASISMNIGITRFL